MKKIIVLVVCGFLFLSGNSLFAQINFDDCFEIERLKAKSDGLGSVESADQASKVCKLKLGIESQVNTAQTPSVQNNTINKTGGFIGISPLHSGTYTSVIESTYSYTYESAYSSYSSARTSSSTSTKIFDSGLGLKVGYNSSNSRISYNNYTWNIDDAKIKNSLIIYDYVADSGFYYGVGIGNGTVEAGSFSESGIAFGFNLGYDFNIDESFQIGLGYLISSFGYTLENSTRYSTSKSDVNITTATLFLALTYRF